MEAILIVMVIMPGNKESSMPASAYLLINI